MTLQTVQFDYDQAELQTAATQDALNELRSTPLEDIKMAYRTFKESAARMELVGQRLVEHANGMYLKGPGYLKEAESSAAACEIPRLRNRNSRPVDLGDYFDEVADRSWGVKHAYRAYQFDIRQIRDYIDTHADQTGIDTMTVFFRKAQLDGLSLEDALERASAAMERAKAAKAAAAPNPS